MRSLNHGFGVLMSCLLSCSISFKIAFCGFLSSMLACMIIIIYEMIIIIIIFIYDMYVWGYFNQEAIVLLLASMHRTTAVICHLASTVDGQQSSRE